MERKEKELVAGQGHKKVQDQHIQKHSIVLS